MDMSGEWQKAESIGSHKECFTIYEAVCYDYAIGTTRLRSNSGCPSTPFTESRGYVNQYRTQVQQTGNAPQQGKQCPMQYATQIYKQSPQKHKHNSILQLQNLSEGAQQDWLDSTAGRGSRNCSKQYTTQIQANMQSSNTKLAVHCDGETSVKGCRKVGWPSTASRGSGSCSKQSNTKAAALESPATLPVPSSKLDSFKLASSIARCACTGSILPKFLKPLQSMALTSPCPASRMHCSGSQKPCILCM